MDSSSWYLKSDHEAIITLRELRNKLPSRLVSLHVRDHQDDEYDYDDLTRSEQLNVLADYRTTCSLKDLCVARQPTQFYPLPACRGYLRDATGFITSREKRTLRTECPKYELWVYLQ
jgi:hypothetical protein